MISHKYFLLLSLILIHLITVSLYAEVIEGNVPGDGSELEINLASGVYKIEVTGSCLIKSAQDGDPAWYIGPKGESTDGGVTWNSWEDGGCQHDDKHGFISSVTLTDGCVTETGPKKITFRIKDDYYDDNNSGIKVVAISSSPSQDPENTPTPPDQKPPDKNDNSPKEGDPVNISNGQFSFSNQNFPINGRVMDVVIKHSYRNRSDYNSPFGYGWDMNYNCKIRRIKSQQQTPLENYANTEGDASNSSYGGSHITLIPEPWVKSYCNDESESTALGLGGDSGWSGYSVWYTAQVDWTTPHKITHVECVSEAVRNPTGTESLELKIDGVWTQINSRNSIHGKDTLVKTGFWDRVTGVRNVKSSFIGNSGNRNYHKTYQIRALGYEIEEVDSIIFMDGSNNKEEFAYNAASGYYENSRYHTDYFEYISVTDTYVLHMAHGVRYFFDSNGNLSEIRDRNDNTLTFEYSQTPMPIIGFSSFSLDSFEGAPYSWDSVIAETHQLEKITNDLGKEIIFDYYTSNIPDEGNTGLLKTITYKPVPGDASKDRCWTYKYDEYNNLKSVTKPATAEFLNGLTTTFNYGYNENGAGIHDLISVVDPEQQAYVINDYENGTVVNQDYGSGNIIFEYDFNNNKSTTYTLIDDKDNADPADDERLESITEYNDNGSTVSKTLKTDLRDPANPQTYITSYEYYADGSPIGSVDKTKKVIFPRGNSVSYEYDSSGNINKTTLHPAPGSDEETAGETIVTEFTYETVYNYIKTVKDPKGNLINYTYDYELSPAENLVINEFMADNSSTIEDPDEPGEYPDWIEIYNPAGMDIDMEGMVLSDGTTQYIIPAGIIINAGDHKLFWADGDDEQGALHTTFKLGASGEQIILYDTDGLTVIDQIQFGQQVENVSQGRRDDGFSVWQSMSNPTPDAANNGSTGLVINEFMADNTGTIQDPADSLYQDWIEIYNPTDSQIDMNGMILADDTTQYVISQSVLIGPGEYLIFWADGENSTQGVMHTTFALGKSGDQISLFDSNGRLTDQVIFGSQQTDISSARIPDGGSWGTLSSANPGVTNFTPSGNLLAITYPAVNTPDGLKQPKTRFTYNSFGQLKTITSPDGIVTEYQYYEDPADNNNYGRVKRITYDKDMGEAGVTCEEIAVEYQYDEAGNVNVITDNPDGSGNPGDEVISTLYQYDELNQLKTITPPSPYSALVTEFTYTGNKKVKDIINYRPNYTENQVTSFDYNILDHLKTITDPLNNPTVFDYDFNEHVSKSTDAENIETCYLHDERGLLWKVTDAQDLVTEYSYDENGNLSKIKVSGGRIPQYSDLKIQITLYKYDGFDRLEEIIYQDNSSEKYEYDAAGNLKVYTNRAGITTAYIYDALNRVEESEVLDQTVVEETITYLYDIASRPDKVTKDGLDTTFTYDRHGRIETVVDITNRLVRYDYDVLGRQDMLEYPDGMEVTYQYDKLSRLTDIKDTSGNVLAHYNYDDLSRRVQVQYDYDGDGSYDGSIDYDYEDYSISDDDLGDRIEQVTNNINGSGITFDYTYDNVGNRKTEIHSSESYDYKYDSIYQLETVDKNSSRTHTYVYDQFGNRHSMNDGTLKKYAANSMNQYISTGTDFYCYDAKGNLTGDGEYVYTYDNQNRLVGVAPVASVKSLALPKVQTAAETTSYIPNPNLEYGKTYYWWVDEVDTSSQITYGDIWGFTTRLSDSVPSLHPDKGVYSTTDTITVDFTNAAGWKGDLINFGKTPEFSMEWRHTDNTDYDSERILSDPSGISNGSVNPLYPLIYQGGYSYAQLWNYSPDDDYWLHCCARTIFAVNNNPQDTAKSTYPNPAHGTDSVDTAVNLSWTAASNPDLASHDVYLEEADNIPPFAAYEYDYAGRRSARVAGGVRTEYVYDGAQVIAEYDDHVTQGDMQLVRKYIYGPGIDEPIAMINVDITGDKWYFYHYDALGNVIALSNDIGTVVEKYSYDAFGNTTVTLDGNTGNPYRFTGRRWDEETGLYYYRARMYSPQLGRFLQPDPIGYEDGMNMYAYVGNNPLNWVDPSGLGAIRWLYTGDWNASDETYEAATDKAAAVILQWGITNRNIHKKAGVWVADGVSGIAANVALFWNSPKSATELRRGLGPASRLAKDGNSLRRIGIWMKGKKIPGDKLLSKGAAEAKRAPIKAATKAFVAGVAAVEAGVGIYSGVKAAESNGIHTFPDGTTYDPLGEDFQNKSTDNEKGS